jgi:hypothetical protein
MWDYWMYWMGIYKYVRISRLKMSIVFVLRTSCRHECERSGSVPVPPTVHTYINPRKCHVDSIRFDSIRFDSIRFDSIRFDSIRFDDDSIHSSEYIRSRSRFCFGVRVLTPSKKQVVDWHLAWLGLGGTGVGRIGLLGGSLRQRGRFGQ